MFFFRRLLLFTLVLVFLVSLGHPTQTKAEEPTPFPKETPPSEPLDSSLFMGNYLLSSPAPPEGCLPDTFTFTNSQNTPIPDQGVMTSTITIDGVNPYLWDVNLTTHIQHTFSSDLDIFLISPDGTESTITTDNGSGYDHVFNGTLWDDQWVGFSVADYPYANTVVVPTISPEEAMGAFIGENPNGTWQLVIRDDAQQDTGALVSWGLTLTTFPYVPDQVDYTGVSIYPDVPVPDGGTYTAEIDFPAGRIHDLWTNVNIHHPYNADLDIWLVSPTGITVTLTTDNGSNLGGGFANTIWADDRGFLNPPGPVTDVQFEDGVGIGTVVAENALSAFDGTEGGGTWTLIIKDDTAGNAGTFESWILNNYTYACIPDLGTYHPQTGGVDVALNEPVFYPIVVYNTGSALAENILMTDTLPTGLTFLSWTPAPGWVCETPPVGGTGTVTCSGPDMLPDESFTHTLQLSSVSAPQPLDENQVVVSTSSPETYFVNNHAEKIYWARYRSANTSYWDVQDNLDYLTTNQDGFPKDDGAVKTGAQFAFTGWGALKLRVQDAANTILTDDQAVEDFDLTFTGNGWVSNNTPSFSGISINRTLYAPQTENYLRYLDTFTNNTNDIRQVSVAWGGYLGSANSTTLAGTSSGDLILTAADQWAFTIRNATFTPTGPAESPPAGFLVRGAEDTSYLGAGDYLSNPFETPWPGNGNFSLGQVFSFTLQPGETKHLLYFIYRGLEEERPAPDDCTTNCYTPPAGSEIALAHTELTALASAPDFCGLSDTILANLINWPGASSNCSTTVFLPILVR